MSLIKSTALKNIRGWYGENFKNNIQKFEESNIESNGIQK